MEKNPQIIFSWKAPLRPYKKWRSTILRFYFALGFILSLIFLFFGDKVLIIPTWALFFVFYVLTITPPPQIENRVTTFGIETSGVAVRWESLSHFYFNQRFGFHILTIVGHPPFYHHLYLVVPDEEIKKKLIKILSVYLIYQEKPQKTLSEKMVDLLMKIIPEEKNEEKKTKTVSQTTSPVPL